MEVSDAYCCYDLKDEPPYKLKLLRPEIKYITAETMNKLPIVECEKSDLKPEPRSIPCQDVAGKLKYSPTVPCLYFREELLLRASTKGLTISEKSLKVKRRSPKFPYPSTFASCPWFYEMRSCASFVKSSKGMRQYENKFLPTKRLLLVAHQKSASKVKKLTEMYEVEYIADFKMLQGERFYLIKWAGWPEEANTWESFRNLSCHLLIKEFHQDFQRQLKEYFSSHNTSWTKLLHDKNGFHKAKYAQRLFDALPKQFKYKSSYGDLKCDFRAALKKWQDSVNFSAKKKPYIAVENEVDLELPPHAFTYIPHNIPGAGVTIPNDPLVGCDCKGICDFYSSSCACTISGQKKTGPVYADGLIRIRPGRPIYECNSRCKCSQDCPSRVVQKGSKYTLAIFRTPNGKGWGVKALQEIPKGAFVVEYVGEVITNTEAERRGLEYDSDGITYLFDLDYHETENPMTVDATRYGNVSHFINHSCSPNLQVYNVFIDNMDLSLPRIALFARRKIHINEELSFDYQMTGALGEETGDSNHGLERPPVDSSDSGCEAAAPSQGYDVSSEASDSSGVSSMSKVKCLCNSANCRGWLIV